MHPAFKQDVNYTLVKIRVTSEHETMLMIR